MSKSYSYIFTACQSVSYLIPRGLIAFIVQLYFLCSSLRFYSQKYDTSNTHKKTKTVLWFQVFPVNNNFKP